MRNIIANTFLTLDGIMQAPGTPNEDTSGNFAYGGWSVNYWDDKMMQVIQDATQTPADLLLGRKTYEIFAGHWPFVEDNPIAKRLNNATKYVASNTLTNPTWKNTIVLVSDVAAQIKKLKQEEGYDIEIHGSANLLQTLMREGLVDTFNIFIFPLVLGSGKRLFENGIEHANLRLVKQQVSGTGVIMTQYVPNGKLTAGSLGPEGPSKTRT